MIPFHQFLHALVYVQVSAAHNTTFQTALMIRYIGIQFNLIIINLFLSTNANVVCITHLQKSIM